MAKANRPRPSLAGEAEGKGWMPPFIERFRYVGFGLVWFLVVSSQPSCTVRGLLATVHSDSAVKLP